MSKFFLMTGMSGSGKTTFAKLFAKRNNLLYLCPDDFYALVNGDERLHIHEYEIWRMIFDAIRLAERDQRDIILDTNSPTRANRVSLLDTFPEVNEYIRMEMRAPFEGCWENNKNRNRTSPEKDFQMIWESLEPVAEEKEGPRQDKIFSCKWGEEGVEVLR